MYNTIIIIKCCAHADECEMFGIRLFFPLKHNGVDDKMEKFKFW